MVQKLDEIVQKLREGKLVPKGPGRKAYIRREGWDVEPGEVFPGPYIVVNATKSGPDSWEARIVPLVEPEPPESN